MLVIVRRMLIVEVEIPPAIAAKINSKHGITVDEVRDVCFGQCVAKWHTDPTHGRRLLVTGSAEGGRRLKVILQPVNPSAGMWRLRTALVARKK